MTAHNALFIDPTTSERAVQTIVEAHGAEAAERAGVGARQVAAKWLEDNGTQDEYVAFCADHFITEPERREAVFTRFERNMEQIYGHLLEIYRAVKEPIDLDMGPIQGIDEQFARFDLFSHMTEDLFKSGVAFTLLLNFRHYTLEEKLASGPSWDRQQWAQARMVEAVFDRVPPAVDQEIHTAFVAADSYINDYNIYMNRLLDGDGERLFPTGLKLISHWGLRDELKARYRDKDGLPRQKLIQQVMEKIIAQEIPQAIIDNPHLDWNVATNTVTATANPDDDCQARPDKKGVAADEAPEDDNRYAHLLNIYRAEIKADPFYPSTPRFIDRRFESGREIPETEVVAIFESVLKSQEVKDTAALIAQRLGRALEPFDIWYDEFKPKALPTEELDRMTQQRYPNAEAFQKDVPHILETVGFDRDTAAFLSARISVDAGRGAGHALGAGRRGDNAHLRTRIGADGMSYQSFNVAMHELGHNVEQVFSLERMDHYLLSGVPNTAFTEGFAFTFQNLDLKVLGVDNPDPNVEHLRALSNLWGTFEIAGVALVDIGIWRWMYDHPEATPAELKRAAEEIARGVWNDYFAPVLGTKDQVLLAVYSHIIDAGLYTPDYPLGLIIQFQLGDYFKQHGLPKEAERMCKLGELTPREWMKQAIGEEISTRSMLDAARKALGALA